MIEMTVISSIREKAAVLRMGLQFMISIWVEFVARNLPHGFIYPLTMSELCYRFVTAPFPLHEIITQRDESPEGTPHLREFLDQSHLV